MSILLRSVRRGLRVVGAASVLAMGCAHTGRPPLTDWEQAEDYLRTGQGARAVPLLEAMHARNPKDYEVARSLVEAHDQAGQSAALAQRLQGEVSKNPSAVGHYMRGLALFAATHEATPEGVAEFERALALEPRRAELHYRLGLTYVESEQYEAALAPLRRAAELAPYRRAVQLPLSKVLSKLGDRKGAVAALARVVSLGPTREEVATARALIAAWDPIAKLPEGARGDFERGMHALTQDSPQDALTAFEAVVQTHPDLAFGPALLGLAYQRLDDPGRAVESFRRSIELDPSQALPHLYLGNL
ncbi:MAG TPA: tetratricopeptide repeat protein, partial [Myxococcaceae bacterium]|nr:tetratricopeptide repeat protein [Myxococcaceae bacterium]